MLKGDGRFPVNFEDGNAVYHKFLRRFRRALRECCGLKKAEAALFGMQSLRRGGNTALWRKGASQDQRLAMGAWKTPEVEEGYLDWLMEDKIAMMTDPQGGYMVRL